MPHGQGSDKGEKGKRLPTEHDRSIKDHWCPHLYDICTLHAYHQGLSSGLRTAALWLYLSVQIQQALLNLRSLHGYVLGMDPGTHHHYLCHIREKG